MPKSLTTGCPACSRIFSGLMSRCTIPSPWAYARASATSRMILSASSSGSCFSAVRRSRRDSPLTYGMTKYRKPGPWLPSRRASPESYSGRIWGWLSWAAISISRRNRADPIACATSGRSTLTATRRRCFTSSARKTTAMPPCPSSRSSRYRLARAARRSSTSSGRIGVQHLPAGRGQRHTRYAGQSRIASAQSRDAAPAAPTVS